MRKFVWVALALSAVLMLAGCDTGNGSGGTNGEVGLVEEDTPPDGSYTFKCVTFKWWIIGDDLKVNVVIDNYVANTFTVSGEFMDKPFNCEYNGCHTYGKLVLYAKSIWHTGSLEGWSVTVVKDGHTYTFTGVMGTW